jgi:hypothetical protein
VTLPREQRDVADVACEVLVALARRGGIECDHFDQPGFQREAIRVIRRPVRIGGLAQPSHPSNK